MARKADYRQTLPRTRSQQAKGALSLTLRRGRAVARVCLVVWLAAIACAPFAAAESPDRTTLLLDSVNQTRAQAGVPPLRMNAELANAAMAQARHVAAAGRLSHLGPNGENLGARLQEAAYDYAETAENLASGPTDPARIVSLWQASPGHNRNILNPAYSEAGIGRATSQDLDYWVMIFARPGGT